MISFHMKNTTMPLSIAFIDKKGVIKEIKDMEPGLDSSVRPSKPAQYALEVNRGWFSKNKIKVGAKVKLSFPRVLSVEGRIWTIHSKLSKLLKLL